MITKINNVAYNNKITRENNIYHKYMQIADNYFFSEHLKNIF